jgi:hypothetical protein
VIVRVSRARVRAGKEQHVVDTLRAAAAQSGPAPRGLRGLLIARKSGSNGTPSQQIVGITLWADLQSLTAALGPNWDRPTTLPGLEEFVEDPQVEHFETMIDSVAELFERA